uniref:End-joining factor 1 n=2 Tax=Ceratitis capitata TaxID=7213 RepID=W8BNZ4_CERCA
MSKELIIEDKTYFYDCAVKGNVIEYLLYDSGNNWIATKTSEEVAHTLQLLNKRIKYDVQIAYDTLQNTQPETASWVKSNDEVDGIAELERVLKLKYRIKGCPFNFEWRLKRNEDKKLTIQLPVNHVTRLVDTLPSKIEELLDVLQRKEREIKQYRLEKGSLRRSTLATPDFDVEQFREEYATAETSVKSLQNFLTHWRMEHGVISTIQEEENARPSSSCTKNAVKKEEEEAGTSSPSRSKLIKESPRNKKRKALQNYKTQMVRTLKTSKKQLEYESQSQSLSESEIPAALDLEEAISNKRKAENSLLSNEDESMENAVKRRKTIAKTTASSTPKPLTNSIDECSSKSTKEVSRSHKRPQFN